MDYGWPSLRSSCWESAPVPPFAGERPGCSWDRSRKRAQRTREAIGTGPPGWPSNDSSRRPGIPRPCGSWRAAARQDRDQRVLAIYSRLIPAGMKPEDFFLLGRALSLAGQAKPAIKALEIARAGNPDDADTLDLLCRLYYQNERYYAAEEAARRLVASPIAKPAPN